MKNKINFLIILTLLFFSSCEKEAIVLEIYEIRDETFNLKLENRYNYDIPDEFLSTIIIGIDNYTETREYVSTDYKFVKQEDGSYQSMTSIPHHYRELSIHIVSWVNDRGWNLEAYSDLNPDDSLSTNYVLDMSCGYLRIAYDEVYNITDSSASFAFEFGDFGFDTIEYQGVCLDTIRTINLNLAIDRQVVESSTTEINQYHFSDLEPNTKYYLSVFIKRENEEEDIVRHLSFITEEE